MKKINLFLAVILLLTACNKKQTLIPVRVHINDFSFSQEEIPSKGAIADYNNIKAVTLAFYTPNGAEQYKLTQLKCDHTTYTTFGNFDLSLPMGTYTMVVLGYEFYDNDILNLTSPTTAAYTSDHIRETFATTQTVNVANTNALELNATLNRIVAKLRVESTDGKTENVNKVRMTFSQGSKNFNPTSGLATDNNGLSNTVGTSTADVGSRTISTSYLFLATDEQTMTVTLDVLNADENTISHKVVNNVPFKRNRVTILKGSLYNADGSGSFQVNTDFIDTVTITF